MRYRVPIYRVGCKGNVIIWQVDVAFDERHDHNMQVVKGISKLCLEGVIGKSVPDVRIFSLGNLRLCRCMLLLTTSSTYIVAC